MENIVQQSSKIVSMVDEKEIDKPLHVAMYSWFAFGHLTSFLQLANNLAERGHKISFFLPTKTQPKLRPHNHHPHLITFIPITVPAVEGLPQGAETTADVPFEARSLIMAAMDLTQDTIDSLLGQLKPNLVFFDFTEWLPGLARKHGAKSVYYATIFGVGGAYFLPRARAQPGGQDLTRPPPGYPPSKSMITLRPYEALAVGYAVTQMEFGGPGKNMLRRHAIALEACDALAIKTCREMEEVYCDFIHNVYKKPLFLAGPVVPEMPKERLDDQIDGWLSSFDKNSVVYCALGSECFLSKDHFQQLLLGLELTGMPFLAALKPPRGCETIESGLPEGFAERTKGRGVVHCGWVQQQRILQHPSVGCFVTHCGAASLMEAMVSECQMVLFPQVTDQFVNARMMSLDLKVGVEVEKVGENGELTKDGICKAIKLMMETNTSSNGIATEARMNHAKWREFLLPKELQQTYISGFIDKLRDLINY